jgi:hypothetical protein
VVFRAAYWPAVVIVISVISGCAYGLITSHLISDADIRTQIVEQCRATPGVGVEHPRPAPERCASKENFGEIKGRVTWAVSAGVTAISGTASFVYCIVAPISLVWPRRSRSSDPDYRNAYLALITLAAAVIGTLVFMYLGGAGEGFMDTFFVNSIRSSFDALFATIQAPSHTNRIDWVVSVWVLPTSALVIASTLAAYLAACAACTARIVPRAVTPRQNDRRQEFPADAPQEDANAGPQIAGQVVPQDPASVLAQEVADILAARMRLLNRVVLVSSAAMTLAILSTNAFSAWPSALVGGMGGDTFSKMLAELGTAATLHWATALITFALPAYLVAISVLSWHAQAVAALTVEGYEPAKRMNRYAAEQDWMKAHGMEVDWPAIVKSVVAIFTPLLAGTVTTAAAALIH